MAAAARSAATAAALALLALLLCVGRSDATQNNNTPLGCVKRAKRSSVCLACDASSALVNGTCVCPPGSALKGTAGTACTTTNKGRDRDGGGGKCGSKGVCCPCTIALPFQPAAVPASVARCAACPPGSSPAQPNKTIGCAVPPGSYFSAVAARVYSCPVDAFCLGGLIVGGSGPSATPCPPGTSTNGTTGAASASACSLVLPGFYFNKTVQPCPDANQCCPGGPIAQSPPGPSFFQSIYPDATRVVPLFSSTLPLGEVQQLIRFNAPGATVIYLNATAESTSVRVDLGTRADCGNPLTSLLRVRVLAGRGCRPVIFDALLSDAIFIAPVDPSNGATVVFEAPCANGGSYEACLTPPNLGGCS